MRRVCLWSANESHNNSQQMVTGTWLVQGLFLTTTKLDLPKYGGSWVDLVALRSLPMAHVKEGEEPSVRRSKTEICHVTGGMTRKVVEALNGRCGDISRFSATRLRLLPHSLPRHVRHRRRRREVSLRCGGLQEPQAPVLYHVAPQTRRAKCAQATSSHR